MAIVITMPRRYFFFGTVLTREGGRFFFSRELFTIRRGA